MREVFPALSFVGEELERMHPRTYNGIARQISRAPGGDLQSSENTAVLLGAVARELFKADITWGKVRRYFHLINRMMEVLFPGNVYFISPAYLPAGDLAVCCLWRTGRGMCSTGAP